MRGRGTTGHVTAGEQALCLRLAGTSRRIIHLGWDTLNEQRWREGAEEHPLPAINRRGYVVLSETETLNFPLK